MQPNYANRALAFIYAATIFVSAFLLFQIEPMVSKAILPWFGGTPAVWTICLLFFQTLLFAGYAYAHFTNAAFRPWQQAIIHIIILIVALRLLQAIPDASRQPRGDADPTRAILAILTVTIGLPYFVLSATGPLLQAWFARSFPGRTPYRLYALSNVGSLLALLTYPFLFELQLDLAQQARFWSIGFIAFAVLCACAAWCVRNVESCPGSADRAGPRKGEVALSAVGGLETEPNPQPALAADTASEPPSIHYLLWLLLPAFASVVLMATTNHISTDVAVVPLLWVVPLALYLLTFIIAFDRPSWHRPLTTAIVTLVALYPAAAMYVKHNAGTLDIYDCGMTGSCLREIVSFFSRSPANELTGPHIRIGFLYALVANYLAMFGICMLCHGKLARLRPATKHLTAYYLMIAAGGALGGIAVSLIAPHVFTTIFEWPLSTYIAAVAIVGMILYAAVNRAVGAGWDLPQSGKGAQPPSPPLAPRLFLVALLLPIAFVMLDLTQYLFAQHKNVVYQSRNFFGALTIRNDFADNPAKDQLVLLNGTTEHGSQFTSVDRRIFPTSYYATTSGVGLVLAYFHNNRPPGGVRIGDVGLGAGTLAAYALKSDHLRFYEINPTVIDISTGGKWFTFYGDAVARGAHCDIKLGDARLTLQNELANPSLPRSEEGRRDDDHSHSSSADKILPYHVLVLDAFSGDAVPTHLLTKEAMDIYMPHLASESNMGVDGALLIHVSNRYLDLERVARGAAEYLALDYLQIRSPADDNLSINAADWCVLTRNKDLLAALKPNASKPSSNEKPPVLWTDAHSSLFEIVR